MSRAVFILIAIIMASTAVIAIEDGTLVGNAQAGKAKSETCVACHGPDGNSPTPIWPKIAGLSQGYILKQLLEFKKGPQGDRNVPTMFGILQPFSDQDLADLAAFYAEQKTTIGTVPEDKLALGQKIYRGGNISSGVPACAGCHDATGMGNYLANFPRVSGQNSEYIVDQLTKFKNKTRTNIMMNDIAPRLTDEEIQAVASYVEGLH